MPLFLLFGCLAGQLPGEVSSEDVADGDRLALTGPRDASPPPRPEDAFLYGDETLDLAIDLSEEAIAAFADTRHEVDDAPWVPATFRWSGESYEVGVRLKGGMGSFRPFDDKPSFKIDFATGDPDQRFSGARYLVLNNLIQDDAMLGEHAAYFVYGALGLPAGRHGYARVTVNGEWFGLYGIVEPIERDLVARYWPDDAAGLLLDGGVDLVPGDEEGYQVVQGGDMTPVYEAAAALQAAPPEQYLATLDSWFEAEELLTIWAIELASGNPDAYVTRHNNYYLYWRASDARWTMLPWGTDTAFIDHLALDEGWYEGELYLRCLEAPPCEQALLERLTVVTEWFETGALQATMRAVGDRTEADCLADPRSDGGADGCVEARERFYTFLEDRPAELREILNGDVP